MENALQLAEEEADVQSNRKKQKVKAGQGSLIVLILPYFAMIFAFLSNSFEDRSRLFFNETY